MFLVASVILWGVFFRRLPRAVRILGWYLTCNLLIQFLAQYLWSRSLNNLPLLHLNTFLEFAFFALFFREIYIGLLFFKKYTWLFIDAMTLFLLYNAAFWEPLDSLNSNASGLVHLSLVFFVILYFFDAYGKVDLSERTAQSISFICFAVMLSYAGGTFIFMFSQFITAETLKGYQLFWIVNGALSTFFQGIVLFSIVRIVFYMRK
ncbi:MAG: hypothetical protein R3C61_26730 [Bacteroidia bacterium]